MKEERLFKSDPDLIENLKTKVYLLGCCPAGADYDEFHAAASGLAQHIFDTPALRQHLIQFVISHKLREPLPLEGMASSAIDVLFELWFNDVAAANAFFAEEEADEMLAAREKALFADKPLRALATRVRVVHDEFSFQPSTTQPLAFSW